MKPSVDKFLQVAVLYLFSRTAPALGPGYEQSNLMTFGALIMAVQQEFDRAAARRVEENDALRRLFAQAVPSLANAPDLADKLSKAAESQSTSLTVSSLERDNAELRALLIELHAHVEKVDSPDAREIEDAIWREFVTSTERRRLALGPF